MGKPRRKLPRRWMIVTVCTVVVVLGGLLAYRAWFQSPTQREIDDALAAQDWSAAASLIRRADLTFDNGLNHFNLGIAATHLGDEEGAIAAFMAADDKRFRRPDARYKIAALYAGQGDEDLALRWLADALEAGFDVSKIEDEVLARLARTPKWREALGEGNEDPEEALSGLNFLLGTWSVTPTPAPGNQTVTFARSFDGMITDSWGLSIPGGASGVFLYDRQANRWNYSYVDGFGRVFTGPVRRTPRLVTVSGTMTYTDGTEVLRRIEIRGSTGVIDYIVADSRDGGRTWEENRQRLSAITDSRRAAF